jgi:hypothetical protein
MRPLGALDVVVSVQFSLLALAMLRVLCGLLDMHLRLKVLARVSLEKQLHCFDLQGLGLVRSVYCP